MTIKIRSIAEDDFRQIIEIFDHPEVVPYSSQHPFLGAEKIVSLFRASAENSVVLVAEQDTNVVGYIKICLNNKPRTKHVAELAMAVHPEAQGQGVGKALIQSALCQADNWLNIIRLELDVYADNDKALNLYKQFDFAIEGEARLAAFKNGEYVNVYKMSRIRDSISC